MRRSDNDFCTMSRLLELARVSISLDTLLHIERVHLTGEEAELVEEAAELLGVLEASMASVVQKTSIAAA